MRSREDGKADHVHIFLKGGYGNLVRGLSKARVDHFKPFISQPIGNHACSSFVPVKAGLRHEHPDLSLLAHPVPPLFQFFTFHRPHFRINVWP